MHSNLSSCSPNLFFPHAKKTNSLAPKIVNCGWLRSWDKNTLQTTSSLSTLATIVADFGDNLSPKTNCDCRRFLRQSPNSATVAVFGDSVDRA